jgi:hypothetical protein
MSGKFAGPGSKLNLPVQQRCVSGNTSLGVYSTNRHHQRPRAHSCAKRFPKRSSATNQLTPGVCYIVAVSTIRFLPAAELLSFLKETHSPWTERDLSQDSKISSAEAKQAVSAMQLQGYAEPIARTKPGRTTEAGLTVSGAKTARLTRKAVEGALSALCHRIQAINNDNTAEYTVSEAVACGDCLSDQARVQAADVGVRLTPRKPDSQDAASAVQHKAEPAFLKQLRGRSAALHIQPYQEWMSARSHRNLVS